MDELIRKITTGSYSFDNAVWEEISDEAKDLIKQTLEIDPDARITAEQALESAWIVTFIL